MKKKHFLACFLLNKLNLEDLGCNRWRFSILLAHSRKGIKKSPITGDLWFT